MFLAYSFHSSIVVSNARSVAELVIRVNGRRCRVEQHFRLVNRSGHGLDGGPDTGVIRESLLVSTDDLAYLQHVKYSLFRYV